MDQLCAAARVSKRTAYQHFAGKDELVAAAALIDNAIPDTASDDRRREEAPS